MLYAVCFSPFPALLHSSLSIGTSSHALRNMPPTSGLQGHPRDRLGGISVRKTCNRLKFSVREMSFRRDKNDVLGTNIGQLGFSGNGQKSPNKFGKTTVPLE